MDEITAGRLATPPIREGEPGGPPAAAPEPQPQHPIDGVVRCASCGRYPLIGEQVTLHRGRRGSGDGVWACEPCETDGRGRRLGEIAGGDRVRSLSGAANVHRA